MIVLIDQSIVHFSIAEDLRKRLFFSNFWFKEVLPYKKQFFYLMLFFGNDFLKFSTTKVFSSMEMVKLASNVCHGGFWHKSITDISQKALKLAVLVWKHWFCGKYYNFLRKKINSFPLTSHFIIHIQSWNFFIVQFQSK